MNPSEQEIRNLMKNTLDKPSSSISFASLWDLHNNKSKGNLKYRKVALVPMIVIFTLLMCFTIGYAGLSRLVDNTDLPFVDDPEVIGKWETVDFVNNISDFDPEKRSTDTELYLNNLVFIKDGKMLDKIEDTNLSYSGSIWTKGFVIDEELKTASKYDIKNIDGSKYIFLEWKSGDYIFRLLKPHYYVLKQTDTENYSNYKVLKTEDKIDYLFVNNAEMIGRWVSVDFVRNIENFNPETLSYKDDLALKELRLSEGGKATSINYKDRTLDPTLSWTDNLIISQRAITASKCEFKQINNETYMFYEWKSGDYIYRGMKPQYYVLKKVD